MIRVGIADDEALIRGGLAVLLRHEPGFEVVGEAADGVAAVSLARLHRPDVLLMDIRMPGMDGLEATRRIVADPAAGTRVLVLTTFDHDENVFAALRAGASGFLPKDTDPDRLLEAIRVVASGESLLAPRATRRLIEEFRRRVPVPPPAGAAAVERLTEREVEVLQAIAGGLSNAEIAEQLCVSYATVKTHVGRLLAKLDARDRAQLVIFAYEHGLVGPRE
jgi:DNA-binding NarL/FixJ family response regulator